MLPSKQGVVKKHRRSLAAVQWVRGAAEYQTCFCFHVSNISDMLLVYTKVRASSYDVMLHRDSRFWEVIAKRNEAHAKDEAVIQDPMYGPTVGRRREFDSTKKADEGQKDESSAFQTFSIGNEFDFLPSDDPKPAAPVKPAAAGPKRDSLMEALMGALDEDDEGTETETIVFHPTSGEDGKPKASSAPPSMGVPPSDKKEDTAPASSPDGKSEESGAAMGSTEGSTGTDGNFGDNDMDALMAEANMNLDDDMDALLAGVEGGEDFMDDDMDADLEDLENFLNQK